MKYDDLTAAQKGEMLWVAGTLSEDFTYCCGGVEEGGHQLTHIPRWIRDLYSKGREEARENVGSPTKEEAWRVCVKDARANTHRRPLMYNVLGRRQPELAKVLREQPDCKEVHTWRNPNTNNIITMFVLTNDSNEDPLEDFEDDDNY
jgi:hypothetical protein